MVRQLAFVPFVQPSPAGWRSRETEQHGAQPTYTPIPPSPAPFMPCLRDAGKGTVGCFWSLLLGISWHVAAKTFRLSYESRYDQRPGYRFPPNHGFEGQQAERTNTRRFMSVPSMLYSPRYQRTMATPRNTGSSSTDSSFSSDLDFPSYSTKYLDRLCIVRWTRLGLSARRYQQQPRRFHHVASIGCSFPQLARAIFASSLTVLRVYNQVCPTPEKRLRVSRPSLPLKRNLATSRP